MVLAEIEHTLFLPIIIPRVSTPRLKQRSFRVLPGNWNLHCSILSVCHLLPNLTTLLWSLLGLTLRSLPLPSLFCQLQTKTCLSLRPKTIPLSSYSHPPLRLSKLHWPVNLSLNLSALFQSFLSFLFLNCCFLRWDNGFVGFFLRLFIH